jgi:hypothetical protein
VRLAGHSNGHWMLEQQKLALLMAGGPKRFSLRRSL